MHSIPLTPSRKQKEWTNIQAIAQNNDFPQTLIQRLTYQIQRKHKNEDHKTMNNKQRKHRKHSHIIVRE